MDLRLCIPLPGFLCRAVPSSAEADDSDLLHIILKSSRCKHRTDDACLTRPGRTESQG